MVDQQDHSAATVRQALTLSERHAYVFPAVFVGTSGNLSEGVHDDQVIRLTIADLFN
ncbi:hypothetical protein D3C71_2096320 [compost metagenome]